MNSLFRSKVFPIVETVEDVINNKQILVYTSKNIDEFKWFNMTYPNVYDQLISKLNEDKLYFENTNLKDEKELRAKGVSEGKFIDFDFEGFTQKHKTQIRGTVP